MPERAQLSEGHGHFKWRRTELPQAPHQSPRFQKNARGPFVDDDDARTSRAAAQHYDRLGYEVRGQLRRHELVRVELDRWWSAAHASGLTGGNGQSSHHEGLLGTGGLCETKDYLGETGEWWNEDEPISEAENNIAPRDELNDANHGQPAVPFEAYARLMTLLYKHLVTPFDLDHAERCAAADWLIDCKGATCLGKGLFTDAVFEVRTPHVYPHARRSCTQTLLYPCVHTYALCR